MKNIGLIPILDFGHGGMIAGQYQTAGKRSPEYCGKVLYEGASNRWIGWQLMTELDKRGIPYYCVSPELTDVSLATRVKRTNSIFAENPSTYLLSLHSNAGGGEGFEGWTSVGLTDSDIICGKFLTDLQNTFTEIPLRTDTSDGDLDKEKSFYVLSKTKSPAVLLELLFMDNYADCMRLWDDSFRSALVDCLAASIETLYFGTESKEL